MRLMTVVEKIQQRVMPQTNVPCSKVWMDLSADESVLNFHWLPYLAATKSSKSRQVAFKALSPFTGFIFPFLPQTQSIIIFCLLSFPFPFFISNWPFPSSSIYVPSLLCVASFRIFLPLSHQPKMASHHPPFLLLPHLPYSPNPFPSSLSSSSLEFIYAFGAH